MIDNLVLQKYKRKKKLTFCKLAAHRYYRNYLLKITFKNITLTSRRIGQVPNKFPGSPGANYVLTQQFSIVT